MSLRFNHTPVDRELLKLANRKLQAGDYICLATLVNIEGSAPYPVGAQMLIDSSGKFYGQITGGCAEQAIADQAALAIAKQENQSHRYGLDSPYFDITLPCGSGIDVYFDCSISVQQINEWLIALQSGSPISQRLAADSGDFTKTYFPNPRLLLFGQGPILVNLANLALQSGFDVACVAQNEETLQRCASAQLVCQSLHESKQFNTAVNQFTSIVSLFHEHALEDDILIQALATEAPYIGALGSRNTHAARCASLRTKGIVETDIQRIHGPVGLHIHANTPAQIAVSILAEVIQVMNQDLQRYPNQDQASFVSLQANA